MRFFDHNTDPDINDPLESAPGGQDCGMANSQKVQQEPQNQQQRQQQQL